MRVTILLLLLTTLGCTMPAANAEIRDREWKLVWVEGFDSMPSGVATPTLQFGSDGRLGGNTGCNTAGASYTMDGENLNVDMVISTRRACLDPQGNALERAYLEAIENAEKVRVAEGQLELLGADGKVLARFRE